MKNNVFLVLEYIKPFTFHVCADNNLMKKRIVKFITIIITVAIVDVLLLTPANDTSSAKSFEDLQYSVKEQVLASGPEKELPWAEDEFFLEKQANTGADVLLGAYRTVLRDPLPGEEFNVHLAADMLSGRTVEPGEVFSQNGSIGPYTSERGFQKGPTYAGASLITTIGGGVCKIASTIYNVTVLSNLEIVERHAHSMPVPYVPYGQDATVAYGARDFKFRNNTSSMLLIWAKGIDNVLYIAFYGSEPSPEIEWKHEVLLTRKAPKNYKTNPSLEQGSERILLEGMDGAVIKSWVTVTNNDESIVKYMGVSDYSPMPYIIERASN